MGALDYIVDRDQHMRPLEQDLSESYNALLRYMQDMGILENVPIATTSESSIVSVSDAMPVPTRALDVLGASTQAGTPTPETPVPILSVDELTLALSGKNLLDTTVWVENKYIGPNGQIGSESGQHYTENYSAVLPGTYCLSMLRNTGGKIRLHGYDSSKSWIRQIHEASLNGGNYYYSTAITIPDGIAYVRLSCDAGIKNQQLEAGSTQTDYVPFTVGLITVPDLLPEGTVLRSLPDGTRDTLALAYLRPSATVGRAVYSRTLTALIGKTTTAATDGVTGTIGVDVMSTTGEIADGPTVLYKLASAQITTLNPIELAQLPAPTATVWCDGGSATPTLTLSYVRDMSAALA